MRSEDTEEVIMHTEEQDKGDGIEIRYPPPSCLKDTNKVGLFFSQFSLLGHLLLFSFFFFFFDRTDEFLVKLWCRILKHALHRSPCDARASV